MYYETIVGESDTVIYNLPDWYDSSNSASLHPPESSERSYTPTSVDEYVLPPLEETPFDVVKKQRLIKMTPFSKGKITTSTPLIVEPHKAWRYTWKAAHKSQGSDPHLEYFSGFKALEVSYNKQFDISYLTEHHPSLPFFGVDESDYADTDSALNSVRGDAIADLQSTWDLLTESAEFPEVLRLLVGVFRAFKDPAAEIKNLIKRYKKARKRGKTHQEALDDLSSAWLALRYAIMPLVYSIQDILELLEQQGIEFKTGRSRDQLDLNGSRRDAAKLTNEALYQEIRGSITVSAVGKSKFETSGLRLSDQMNFNLFLTAWELIPFSFVIDWFINVGEVIVSHTSTLASSAISSSYCSSVRKRITVLTKYYHSYEDSYERSDDDTWGYLQDGQHVVVRPTYSYSKSYSNSIDALAKKVDIDTYSRTLFKPFDVNIDWTPNLSWLKSVDALALILQQIISSLR